MSNSFNFPPHFRKFSLPCSGCSVPELVQCIQNLEWKEESVFFKDCQEFKFKGESYFCGENCTKMTTRSLLLGEETVVDVVTAPFSDCEETDIWKYARY